MSTSTHFEAVPTANVNAEEGAILAVVENLRQANHDKNVARFAAQFASDAAVYNLAPPLTHHGIDKVEKQLWYDGWNTPVDIETRDFKVEVSGDLAFCYGFMHMHAGKPGMAFPVSFWMRETVCLMRTDGKWTIVHEHTSVPFYMDGSLRPAFDLQP
jgi:ketosteroid isomerase-like protein